jgi:multiple sugar transport system substrate-binding protein
VRESIAASADPVNQQVFAYIDLVGRIASQTQPLEPAGQIEIEAVSKRINEELAFGKLSPEEAAARFRKEATDILSKS